MPLFGCTAKVEITENYTNDLVEFVEVGRFYSYGIVYNKETKVMYAVEYGNGRGFNVLVNPDGTPMLWEE